MAIALATGGAAIVASGAAGSDRHIGVEFGRCPTGVALMASRAVGRGADVAGIFARGGLAVMAIDASGGAGEGAVVSFGSAP